MHDLGLIDGTMQVTNMAGGGGGVAYAHVSKERNDDNNLIVAASNATTARLSQGAYPDSTADDVRFLATFGAEYGTIAVAKDSDIKDLKDLMNRVVADPRSIAWSGGSSVGGYDHIKPLLLANAAGLTDVTKLKYVAFDGGGEAMTALLSKLGSGFVFGFLGNSRVCGIWRCADFGSFIAQSFDGIRAVSNRQRTGL